MHHVSKGFSTGGTIRVNRGVQSLMQMSPGVIASPVGVGTHKMNEMSELINTALDRIRGVSSEAGAPKILPKGPYVIRNLRHAV